MFFIFFFNDPATTEIYTLSLHDALPICSRPDRKPYDRGGVARCLGARHIDRKSTRLNSSHEWISYAVFCLKKKKKKANAAAATAGIGRKNNTRTQMVSRHRAVVAY